jgi:hypothetical protein
MKSRNITYLIFMSSIILGCRRKSDAVRELGEHLTKLYYLDTRVDTAYANNENGHFRLNIDNSEYFKFRTPTIKYEIYYDNLYTRIAEKIVFTLKDKIGQYQRFDHNGNLVAESFEKNGHSFGRDKYWNKNRTLEKVVTYNDKGEEINDSSFFENGRIKEVYLYNNYTIFKELYFYRNGNVAKEIFDVPDHSEYKVGSQYFSVFTITYDSLTQKQSMFYNNDTTWEDKKNPGTFMGCARLIPADSAEVKKLWKINRP